MTKFSQVFRSISLNKSIKSRHQPMINSLTDFFSSYYGAQGQRAKKQNLMRLYKSIPELTAIVNKVAIDIIKKWHFEKVNPKETGRNKILRANHFAAKVKYRNVLFTQIIDKLITGEAFGWMKFIEELAMKEAIAKVVNKRWMPYNEKKYMYERLVREIKATEGLADISGIDEHLLTPRILRAMASSTIEIQHDNYDIIRYREVVGSREEFYSPKEVIHFPLMTIDGKITGFTPVESILIQVELLRMMWVNMLMLNKNGGVPDFAFILKDLKVNSPEYKRIEQQLDKFKIIENKHGNMLFTGDLKIEALQQLEKMQFMDVGLYSTSILAMQWEVPRSNLPLVMKDANTKDDSGGTSEGGYWERIDFMQRDFADEYNSQLWIPHFGVKLCFDNAYFQRDVREQTFFQMKFDNVKSMDETLKTTKLRMKKEKKLSLLDLDEEDVEEIPQEELDMEMAGANGMGNQLDKQSVEKGGANENTRQKKKTEQQNLMSKRGTPSGIGKEATVSDLTEYKQLIGSDPQIMDLNTFVRLYHEDAVHLGNAPPRIFMRSNEDVTSFSYKSMDFVYKSSINTNLLEDNRVRLDQIMPNVVRL